MNEPDEIIIVIARNGHGPAHCPDHFAFESQCKNCDEAYRTLNGIRNDVFHAAYTKGQAIAYMHRDTEVRSLLRDLNISKERRAFWRKKALDNNEK